MDPPFNSKATYNVLFHEKDGTAPPAQIMAFHDSWKWDEGAEDTLREVGRCGPKRVSDLLEALLQFLGRNDMMAYLTMMAPRLLELRRVLKPTGSLYLHCDEVAAHYLKLVMDGVFGPERFLTEIVWQRTNVHSDSKCWSDVRDSILLYAKWGRFTWNPQYVPFAEKYVQGKYRYADPDGRRYRLDNMTSPSPRPRMMYEWRGYPCPPYGWRYQRETMQRLHDEGRIWYPTTQDGELDTSKRPQLKRYLEEMPGVLMGNVWTDIPPINSRAKERLGYETQKPEALLKRIILASSNEGDTVLDPFCGCGTTIIAAEELHRSWIGIDITHLAITPIRRRLRDSFEGSLIPYNVTGEPQDVPSARSLAEGVWSSSSAIRLSPSQIRACGFPALGSS